MCVGDRDLNESAPSLRAGALGSYHLRPVPKLTPAERQVGAGGCLDLSPGAGHLATERRGLRGRHSPHRPKREAGRGAAPSRAWVPLPRGDRRARLRVGEPGGAVRAGRAAPAPSAAKLLANSSICLAWAGGIERADGGDCLSAVESGIVDGVRWWGVLLWVPFFPGVGAGCSSSRCFCSTSQWRVR